MRRKGTEARAGGHVLRFSVPPDAEHVPTVRKKIEAFARDRRVAGEDVRALVLAVGEAMANAVEHSDATHDIEVQCRVDPSKIIATIVDSGRGVDRSRVDDVTPLPDPMSERGRGIPIMQRCTDMFAIRRLPGGGTGVVLGLLRHIEENHVAS